LPRTSLSASITFSTVHFYTILEVMLSQSRMIDIPTTLSTEQKAQAPCKPTVQKKAQKASSAVLVTALLLGFFVLDACFGDSLWTALSGPGIDKAQLPTSMDSVGTWWWCIEWAFCAWLLLMGARCVWMANCRSGNASVSKHKLQKSPRSAAKEQSQAPSAPSAYRQQREAIEQAAREGKPDVARSLLLKFHTLGLRPDVAVPNMVMSAYTKNGDLQGAERWLEEMKVKGLEVSACSYNTIMDAYAKTKPDRCEAWLSRMSEAGVAPTAVSFTIAIYAYARHGGAEQAEALLVRMKAAGVQPDGVCYNALIHACSVRGLVADVERWVNEMETQGIKASVTTFTAAIDACAKQGEVSQAEAWMERMTAAGLEANVVSYSSLMDACAKAGNPERAGFWYERMIAAGVTPNSHSFSAAISACARIGDSVAAEQWLARAQEAGFADRVIYSGVIDACGKAKDAERAWSIFEQMRSHGVRLHVVGYAALARPFAHNGDFERVEKIAKIMEESGVASNEYFLYAHLLSYGNARPKQSYRAEVVFKQALARGMPVNDHVLTALTRSVGRNRAIELHKGGAGAEAPRPPWRQRA